MIAYGLVECVLISYFKLYHRLTLFSKMKKTSGELVYHSTSRGLRRYKPRLFLSLSFQSQSTYINIFYTGTRAQNGLGVLVAGLIKRNGDIPP